MKVKFRRRNRLVEAYFMQTCIYADYGESLTTACKGGFTRSSVPISLSLPRFFSASDVRTHFPSMERLVSSICLKSGREGDNGSSQGCSRRALKVGRFRGILFKLGMLEQLYNEAKSAQRERVSKGSARAIDT